MKTPFPSALVLLCLTPTLRGDALHCSLAQYRAVPGLSAAIDGDVLRLNWDGGNDHELRLSFSIVQGTPTIHELALRRKAGTWTTLASDLTPDFRIASGLRRITNQQPEALAGLGVKVSPAILDRFKWEAFWDAPLRVPGAEPGHGNSTPPKNGILGQPGLPRRPEEITRAAAVYQARSCEVTTNGARIEVSFPDVQLGVFTGRLQFTIYRGISLIRQEVIAKTDQDSIAYKYDAGIRGLSVPPQSRVRWRDTQNQWRDHSLAGSPSRDAVTLKAANRIAGVEMVGGSIAVFPPPHNFFWARETSANLGYNWYRKDSDSSISIGVRQAESELNPEDQDRNREDRRQCFALRNARPGTWQRMPVYLYVSDENVASTVASALAFTRDDHFKPLAGYQVMATHFHMALNYWARHAGGPGSPVPDLEVLKAAGVNIVAPIDSAPAANRLRLLADYYETARAQSRPGFLVMPDEEILRGDLATLLGGHTDLLLSHPVFWSQGRAPGQPVVESDRRFGSVYHIGSAADLIEMSHRENLLLYMPHPRSKGSTGYPDAIKDTSYFIDAAYRGIGFRWGMGLDGSEQRLSEYRCLPTLDDMNNWMAAKAAAPKFIQATSEIYQQGYGDDVYANNPVNYVKVDPLPHDSNWSPVIDAMKRGDYFVTSGEVLIPFITIETSGNGRKLVAEVEWTFPLEFVELVWGDGERTGRNVISATALPSFGRRRFEITFDPSGKKWVRFAAWDSAGNGAMAQPMRL